VTDIPLRYGCNPDQGAARVILREGLRPPLRVLNGEPSYINILDALTGWQLVRELSAVTGKAAAASYKHASPAGAAVAGAISMDFARSQWLDTPPTDEVTQAYARARGADRVSSFGDAAAVSHPVTVELARLLKAEVSDLIIAPSYHPDALEILRSKRRGRYLILEIDEKYEPPELERRELFGLALEQARSTRLVDRKLFDPDGTLPEQIVETLVVGTTALKYAQSNSVCVAWKGRVIGLGAGQQSRIHCTRLACDKAERWMLQTHPRVLELELPADLGRPERSNAVQQFIQWDELSEPERDQLRDVVASEPLPLGREERRDWFGTFDGLCLSSDAFIPFRDNIDRAAASGVRYVAHAGGGVRAEGVRAAAHEHGIVLIETDARFFLH
jgi:AICAR transformylase/IMP cyclohydrolase PurH